MGPLATTGQEKNFSYGVNAHKGMVHGICMPSSYYLQQWLLSPTFKQIGLM